jgi:hypothetical protein
MVGGGNRRQVVIVVDRAVIASREVVMSWQAKGYYLYLPHQ